MFELIQHTADIRIRVAAATREELFVDALCGLMSIVDPHGVTSESMSSDIALDAPDATVLLVDFLNEALTLAHVGRAIYTDVSFQRLTDTSLAASLRGVRVGGFGEDVKAVTYHEAEVVVRDGNWSTMLVFDI